LGGRGGAIKLSTHLLVEPKLGMHGGILLLPLTSSTRDAEKREVRIVEKVGEGENHG
jgi:hypothetical protein